MLFHQCSCNLFFQILYALTSSYVFDVIICLCKDQHSDIFIKQSDPEWSNYLFRLMFTASLSFWNLKNVFPSLLTQGIIVLETLFTSSSKFYKWPGIVGSHRFGVHSTSTNRMDTKPVACDDEELCNFYFLNKCIVWF